MFLILFADSNADAASRPQHDETSRPAVLSGWSEIKNGRGGRGETQKPPYFASWFMLANGVLLVVHDVCLSGLLGTCFDCVFVPRAEAFARYLIPESRV